jgi:hypothetical protein
MKPICQINHSTHVKEIIVKHINVVRYFIWG